MLAPLSYESVVAVGSDGVPPARDSSGTHLTLARPSGRASRGVPASPSQLLVEQQLTWCHRLRATSINHSTLGLPLAGLDAGQLTDTDATRRRPDALASGHALRVAGVAACRTGAGEGRPGRRGLVGHPLDTSGLAKGLVVLRFSLRQLRPDAYAYEPTSTSVAD